MSARERSQLTATWLRSIQNTQLPLLRPRCYSRQHLKVQQICTHLHQIYYFGELKWLNDGCCCRALDAGGVGGGSCADWNASLLPRLPSREQGNKHRSEHVYEFNSRHFSLEARKSSPQRLQTENLLHKCLTCKDERKLFSARAGPGGRGQQMAPPNWFVFFLEQSWKMIPGCSSASLSSS